jgi:hypothetical protein
VVAVTLLANPHSLHGQGLGDSLADRLRAASNSGSAKPEAGSDQAKSTQDDSAASAATTVAASTSAFGNAPFDLDMLGPLFAKPQPIAESDSAPDLSREAERSFLAGDQAVALRLMFGHMAADYESAQSLIRTVKYSKLLRRPVWNIRFGVSMSVRESGAVTDDANPIPVDGQVRGGRLAGGAGNRQATSNSANQLADAFRGLGNRRNRNSRSSNRQITNSAAAGANIGLNPLGSATAVAGDSTAGLETGKTLNEQAERDLDETLGLVSHVVGEEFTTRYKRGDFGPLLINVSESDLSNDAPATASALAPATAPNRSRPSLGGGLRSLRGNRATAAPPATAPNQTLPRLGSGGLQPLSGRSTPANPPASSPAPNQSLPRLGAGGLRPLSGNPVPSPAATTTPGTSNAFNTATQAEPEAKAEPVALSSPDSLPMWKPGIVFVGSGATKEMIQRAKDADLDVLIHFEVTLKSTRDEPVQNISRCRLINVATGKSFGVSKPMDSNEEQLKSANGDGGRDYVGKRIANLILIIDRDFKVAPLPKLTPEVARRRVGSLLSTAAEKSLRTLAEIRLYQLQQLLTNEEVELAFDIVGGADSLLFLHGTAKERAAIARKWAVKPPTKAGS